MADSPVSVLTFIKTRFPEKSVRDLQWLAGKPANAVIALSKRHPNWVLLKENADVCQIVYRGSWRMISKQHLHDIEKFLGGLTPCNFDMQALLTELFPDKRVIDVTDLVDTENLSGYISLADRQTDLIIVIRRTLSTDSLFRLMQNPGDFYIMHKDDYMYTNRDNLGDEFKRIITRLVRGEQSPDCVVCQEDLDHSLVRTNMCSRCGSKICQHCLGTLMAHDGLRFIQSHDYVKCPVCQDETAFKGRLIEK